MTILSVRRCPNQGTTVGCADRRRLHFRQRCSVTQTEERILELVRHKGALAADEVIDLALYAEGGFYESGHGPGRRKDFLTSPEVGPLFGAVVARALDEWWRALDRPDPFFVVEGGSGAGTLARGVFAAAPSCAPAMRWVCVDRVASQRASVEEVFAGQGSGSSVAVVADLPERPFTGVILCNELLDNLSPVIAERAADGWAEVRVGEEAGRPVEVLVPSEEVARAGERWAASAPVGSRIPLAHQAAAWVERARKCLDAGWVVCFDYGAPTTEELAAYGFDGWLRTYRGHGRGGGWLDDLGGQDITYDIPADQLQPAAIESQAAWLRRFGIEDLVADARRTWREHAAIGDLTALKARSRVSEAKALTDESGLGAYLVLTWPAGGRGDDQPLAAFASGPADA